MKNLTRLFLLPVIFSSTSIFASQFAQNSTDHIKWSMQTGEAMTQPVIGVDGNLFVGSNNGSGGHIYKFTPNGTQLWNVAYDDGFVYKPTVGPNGWMYLVTAKGAVHAIDTNGVHKWVYSAPNSQISRAPTVDKTGNIYLISKTVFCNTYKTDLTVLNPDGSVKWTQTISLFWMNTKPVVDANGTIYYSLSNTMFATDASGQVKWEIALLTDGNLDYDTTQLDSHGVIYTASHRGDIYKLNSDGVLIDTIPRMDPYTPELVNFVVDKNGYIYEEYNKYFDAPYLSCISPDHKVIWTTDLQRQLGFSAELALLPNQGVFVYDSYSSGMAVKDSGNILWYTHLYAHHQTDEAPAIDSNGTVYMGTDNGITALA